MGGKIRSVAAIHHPGLGEGAHVRGGIDEEHIETLQDEIERRVMRRTENLRHRRIEQLDADPEVGLEVAICRQRIGREPHPGRIFITREQTDFQVSGKVGADAKDAVGDAVRLEEHRPHHRALALCDTAALNHGDKHLDERCDWIGGTVDLRVANRVLRLEMLHLMNPLVYASRNILPPLSDAEGRTAPVNAPRQLRLATVGCGRNFAAAFGNTLDFDRGAFIRRAMMLAAAVNKSGLHL